ncbi:HET-domain-containing protein [Lepidopterella palustris CBS 459.81]|uniref:HET-domain-containing protein n=1 Tax=Lepidopterella palustris CBS 459.81 TaxID=1314670 RepID=A0A8E2JKH1_9PEZI|nr:HET-domain-containing protein [Lepidopterella palustris CBS 459.81]
MRLLNVETYKLEFFQNAAEAPPYAILSHRWQEEEVLFEDIQDQPENEEKGWPKVLGCCKNAQVHGVHYVWIDTCCIDQKSSSELSESINSMFSWYQDAKYCIAYLFDVKKSIHEPEGQDQFFFSDWFRRGWTLQELIAPKAVTFYRSDWYLLGLRYNLRGQISAITNIDESVLCHGGLERLSTFSVAAKLAWAAKRQTTRPEDRAYSLMGLFGVNMPTLYGEGEAAAFFRLQIGIFEYSSDQSMLAWQIRQVDHF